MIDAVEVIIRQPGHPDRALRLHEGDTRLGRAEDNEIVLPDAGVSRQHARIRYSRSEVMIEDLGSGNGTYYNGYRIQAQPLHHGDEVVLDPFILRFHISGQVPPARPGPGLDGSQARLEVVVGTGMAGSSYPITERGLSIGRSEEREVVIPDPAASRHHCQISLMGDDYVLQDMGSANGVYVNSVRVRDCTLADGDLIRIGNTEMRFVRYDQQGSDNTTQVVPHEVWHAGAGEPQIPKTILPRTLPPPPAPARRRRSNGLIGLLVGGVVTLLAFLAVVLLGVLVLVFMLTKDDGLPTIPPTPPAWQLQLPNGLESASVDALFQQGAERFAEGDRRGALQDFYRVLQAKPSHHSADRFAFASGELLVLDVLKGEMERRATEQRSHEVTRDRLLRDARRSGRAGRNARAQLEQDFRDDPVAIEAMSWSKTPEMQALDGKIQAAAEALADSQWVDANRLYHEVLQRSDDPTVRKTALAGIRMSQIELLRPRAARWAEATMAEATGQRTEAQRRFRDLAAEDPTNASYRLHLHRLGR